MHRSNHHARLVYALIPIVFLFQAFFAGHRSDAQTLYAGDELHGRLLDPVASRPNMRGRPVRALVIAPAPDSASTALAPGSLLRGQILDAGTERVSGKRHVIDLPFTQLVTLDSD